jgi:FlaA1/EpsC-like NDP-sugar epimerase
MVIYSVILAYLLRFDFHIPPVELNRLHIVFLLVLGIRMSSFLIGKTYAGIIQYSSTEDSVRMIVVVFLGSVMLGIVNLFSYFYQAHYLIPFSIILIESITLTFSLITFRILVKMAYLEISKSKKDLNNILIFGAGEAGVITKNVLSADPNMNYNVIAFLDDNKKKQKKKIENVPIHSPDLLPVLLQKNMISSLIISIQNIDASRKQEIVDVCLNYKIPVKFVPPVKTWIDGKLNVDQIKDIKIDDLLNRDVILLEKEKVASYLNDKTIMITGAAGSIGSEMVRQICTFNPRKIILIDQAETPMFELDMELREKAKSTNYEVAIADIADVYRMRKAFSLYQPQVVFHAAAYKHVPMMENNPAEAIKTNVLGTQNLVDLSDEFKVEKFIMISTDKAVNPTNVMGASKRIAEMYAQAKNKHSATQYITTRFGNVLGSNGSVVRLFKKQIENGGPITVTHPDVTRYFMTIPEACQLVLEAGAMGKGKEIFIFDMGESVKIVDLAAKMIRLAGLEPGKDILISFVGLRPGEKLYEELLAKEENTIPTHHPKIMIAKVKDIPFEKINTVINELTGNLYSQDSQSIVRLMKRILPEYISNNSKFEALDQ